MSIAGWIIWILFSSPIWGTLAWHIWSHDLKPRLIPRDRIVKMAKCLVAAHGADAAELAFMEEDAAWRRGEVFEQGLWRQVRRQIETSHADFSPTSSDRSSTPQGEQEPRKMPSWAEVRRIIAR